MTEPTQQPTLLQPDGRLIGTEAQLRTVQQTQATPGLNINTTGSFNALNPSATGGIGLNPAIAQPFQSGGAGARGDDNPNITRNQTERIAAANNNFFVNAQPNVLNQYASYTYNISWYLLSAEQYKQFTKMQRPSTGNWSLIMQTGGAPANPNQVSSGRNQYFDLDFYMDNLSITTNYPGKITGSVHNATNMSFSVFEPAGVTLIKRLRLATVDMIKSDAQRSATAGGQSANKPVENTKPDMELPIAPTSVHHCMVISFYGYDEQGNLVKAGKSTNAGQYSPASDSRSVVQKFIPFIISNVKFKLQSKGTVEYTIESQPVYQNTAISTDRGSIPFNFALSGENLDQVLNGNPITNDTPAALDGRPSNVNPSPQNTQTEPPYDPYDPTSASSTLGFGA